MPLQYFDYRRIYFGCKKWATDQRCIIIEITCYKISTLMLIKVLSKSFCISLYVNCEVRKHLALVFTIQRPHLFLFQRWLLPHMYRVFHIYDPRIKEYKKAAKFMMAFWCNGRKALEKDFITTQHIWIFPPQNWEFGFNFGFCKRDNSVHHCKTLQRVRGKDYSNLLYDEVFLKSCSYTEPPLND